MNKVHQKNVDRNLIFKTYLHFNIYFVLKRIQAGRIIFINLHNFEQFEIHEAILYYNNVLH